MSAQSDTGFVARAQRQPRTFTFGARLSVMVPVDSPARSSAPLGGFGALMFADVGTVLVGLGFERQSGGDDHRSSGLGLELDMPLVEAERLPYLGIGAWYVGQNLGGQGASGLQLRPTLGILWGRHDVGAPPHRGDLLRRSLRGARARSPDPRQRAGAHQPWRDDLARSDLLMLVRNHPRSEREAALRELGSLLPLAMIALLVANDHVLKFVFHNAVTGKLSDVAICFLMPLLISAALGLIAGAGARWRLGIGAVVTAVVFSALEMSDLAGSWFVRAVAIVFGARHTVLTRDPTDLLALLMVPLAVAYGRQRARAAMTVVAGGVLAARWRWRPAHWR